MEIAWFKSACMYGTHDKYLASFVHHQQALAGVMQKSLKTKEGTDIEAMNCDNIVQDKVPAEVFLNLLHLDVLSPGKMLFKEINLTHQCKTRLQTVTWKTKLYYACVMSLILFKPVLYFSSKACSSQILERNKKKRFFPCACLQTQRTPGCGWPRH